MSKFAHEHQNFEVNNVSPARVRGQPRADVRDLKVVGTANKPKRDPSQGTLAALFDKGEQRKKGTELIARQIEIENMQANQKLIKQKFEDYAHSVKSGKQSVELQKQIHA